MVGIAEGIMHLGGRAIPRRCWDRESRSLLNSPERLLTRVSRSSSIWPRAVLPAEVEVQGLTRLFIRGIYPGTYLLNDSSGVLSRAAEKIRRVALETDTRQGSMSSARRTGSQPAESGIDITCFIIEEYGMVACMRACRSPSIAAHSSPKLYEVYR